MARMRGARSIELDHFVVEVRNVEAAVAYFDAVLGLPAVRLAEWRAGRAPFPSVRISEGIVIDLFPKRLWSGTKPNNSNHIVSTSMRAAFVS